MNIKRASPLFFILFIIFLRPCVGQNVLSGTVIDTTGKKLQNATVSVINPNTKLVHGYALTNTEGYYQIKVYQAENLAIRATHVGFGLNEKPVQKNLFVYNFILSPSSYSLPEVIIKNQNLIFLKGDTLNYNVSQFIKPQDRTIGDIIKNLPGIVVSSTGTITYNGKPINKFYIDGDDILGDRYVIGTNTIPADVASAIQILENHQPIKMLEDKIISENAAINIKLKESSKLRVFGSGNIETGAPFNSTDGRLNNLSFKKKLKIINTYAYTTLGRDINNEVQAQNTGLFWQQNPINLLQQLLGFTNLPTPALPNRYYVNNNSHLLSTNSLLPISKDKSLRINLFWLPEKSVLDNKASMTYYIQNDTISQFENQKSWLANNSFFFNATYQQNTKKNYLQNQFNFEKKISNGLSEITNESNTFNQSLDNKYSTVKNYFLFKSQLKKEKYAEVTSIFFYQTTPENLNIETGLYPWLINNNTIFSQTSQFLKRKLLSHLTETSISKKIDRHSLAIKAEHLIESVNYSSHMDLLQTNNSVNKGDSVFQNRLHWLQQRLSLSPEYGYKYKKIQLQLSIPAIIRNIKYENKITSLDTALYRISAHPALRIFLDLKKYSKIIFTVRRETDFTKSDNLLTGGVLFNYRNLSQSLQNLQFLSSASFSLNYGYRNPIKILFFNTGLIYSISRSPIISSQTFNLGLIQNIQEPFNNSAKRLLYLMNLSKYIFPLKGNVKFNYNGTSLDYYQKQNSQINHLQSTTHSMTLTVNSKPKPYFNSELIINYTTAYSKSKSTKASIGKPVNILNVALVSTMNFTENTFFQLEGSYVGQKSRQNNELLLMDMKLNHTISKSKTDIGIKVINILNYTRFQIVNIDGLQISNNDYWVRPLTVLLTASFRF